MILNVGAIQTRKNIARLVEAFERVDAPWKLVLAGSNGYGAAGILARIQASPARDRISVLGYVPLSELSALYRRASVFAFPSLDEGFGMPVLEAMAAGAAVLTSDRSALPEVAGDAALLVDPAKRGSDGRISARTHPKQRPAQRSCPARHNSGGTIYVGEGSSRNLGRLSRGSRLTILFVDGDLQCAQEAMILRRELDFAGCFEIPRLGLLGQLRVRILFLFAVFVAPVKPDGGFQNQEDIVAGTLDFADRFRDPVGLGKGIVDRVSQFLHEVLQRLFHRVLPL